MAHTQKTEQKIPAPKPNWDILTLKTYFLLVTRKWEGRFSFRIQTLFVKLTNYKECFSFVKQKY